VDALGITDPRRDHHVTVQFEGWRHDGTPARIADHDGRHWVVQQVLGHWTHPDHRNGAAKVGYGIEAERWRLIVEGPLPYRPGRGRQPVAIRTYNDGAGRYLILDEVEGQGRPGDLSRTS
jgi:hypothetical protein